MIDNKGIWRVAKLMIRTHGDHAAAVAAHHVDERLAQGDWIGRDIWRQIVAAMATDFTVFSSFSDDIACADRCASVKLRVTPVAGAFTEGDLIGRTSA